MSDVTFENKYVITRKDHQCSFCLSTIPKKSRVQYWRGMCDGDFFACYIHNECRHYWTVCEERDEYIPGDTSYDEVLKHLAEML